MAVPRWLRQRNCHSCGPVALMNLKKWLGQPVSYAKDYNYWVKKCCCDRTGTPLNCFVDALYSIEDIKVSPRSVPSLDLIDTALKQGKAVVMKSAFMEKGELQGHFFIITERSDKSFFCINAEADFRWWTKASFHAHWLQHYLYYCDECGIAPYAWIVRKL